LRPGANEHADSVVALHAADGSLAWAFQIVKHDLWDYDVPAQPTLVTLTLDGRARDVVVQATKQGLVFVLDRETGAPVFPVEERAVPQGGAPGEQLSPTQTFPADLPPLVPSTLRPEDAFGFTWYDRNACRDRIAALRNEGLYTPPSVQGTLLFPFSGGGVNWGGVAIDPRGVVYVNTSRAPHSARRLCRRQGTQPGQGDKSAGWNSIRDAAGVRVFTIRRPLQQAALGNHRGARSEQPQDPLASAPGNHRRPAAIGHCAQDGRTQFRRADRNCRRPCFHRRRVRSLSARLRCEERRRALAGPPCGGRHGNSDDLRVAGTTVRRHRRWGARRSGCRNERRRRRVRPAGAGRADTDMVGSNDRSTRWPRAARTRVGLLVSRRFRRRFRTLAANE